MPDIYEGIDKKGKPFYILVGDFVEPPPNTRKVNWDEAAKVEGGNLYGLESVDYDSSFNEKFDEKTAE